MRRIVVTGLGAVTPLAARVEASWSRLLTRRSGIRRLPDDVVGDLPAKIGGVVPSLEEDLDAGFDPDVVHASVHTKAYNHKINTQKTAKIKVDNARSDFNVYAVEWTPEEIRGYVNEKQYFTFKNERVSNAAADSRQWPFDKPFHLLLNIAVGGTWGGENGIDEKIWPQRMEIDYVRIYSK